MQTIPMPIRSLFLWSVCSTATPGAGKVFREELTFLQALETAWKFDRWKEQLEGSEKKGEPLWKEERAPKSVCSTGFQGRNHWGGGDLTHRCQAGPGFLPLVSSDSSLLCSRSQPLSSLGGTWGVGWGLCPAAFSLILSI